MVRKHVLVHGVVQGVFFRKSTQEEARRLGLRGWVRNRADGNRVEIVVEGDEAQVQALIGWCEAGGPPAARVEQVEAVDEVDDQPLGEVFEMRPTV